MRIDSERVAVLRRGTAHTIGIAAIAAHVTTFFAAPFVAAESPLLLGLATLIAPLLSIVAARAAAGAPGVRGSIELRPGGLHVVGPEGDRTIPLAEVEGATLRAQTWLEIRLRNLDVISVEVMLPNVGDAFVRELAELGRERVTIRARWPFLSWTPLIAFAGMYLLAGSIVTKFAFARLELTHPLLHIASFAAVVVGAWWAAHAVASPAITLAGDGVTIVRAFSSRFVPLAAIERLESSLGDVALVLRDGRRVAIGSNCAEELPRLLESYLERARRAPMGSAVLERGGRPVDAWRRALIDLAGASSAYRGAQLSREALEVVLEDPMAGAEQRIGAAIALRALDPAYATRVRVAAESSANELLRIALERVADDEIDAAAVDAAAGAEQS